MTDTRIEIYWVYKPKDYLENPTWWDYGNYTIEFNNGGITASMNGEFFDSHAGIIAYIRHEIENYFSGAQLKRNMAYVIDGGAHKRILPDGRTNTTLNVHDSLSLTTSDHIDLVQKNEHGIIVRDTRKERIEETDRLGNLAVKYRNSDQTAYAILDSFNRAMTLPDTELVHLYEIRDSLAKKFNGNRGIVQNIGIDGEDIDHLHALANDDPLNQGRHRGSHVGQLRDATKEELEKARKIAADMITAYLEWLDTAP